MAGVYRQRHPERTVLYRVLFHYFERFLGEYEQLLVSEGGSDREGRFHSVSRFNDDLFCCCLQSEPAFKLESLIPSHLE